MTVPLDEVFVPFPAVERGVWIDRPHRFVVRVRLESGEETAAHTNNSGSMKGCGGPGRLVLVTPRSPLGGHLPYRLRAVGVEGGWAGVDTSMPAAIVKRALELGGVGPLQGYQFVRREVVVHAGSRLDLEMQRPDGRIVYGEIKNVTLWEDGSHRFPDATSQRASKHLQELMGLAKAGSESWIVFVVQRPEVGPVRAAESIDPVFARTLERACRAGVRMTALHCWVGPSGVGLSGVLPVRAYATKR